MSLRRGPELLLAVLATTAAIALMSLWFGRERGGARRTPEMRVWMALAAEERRGLAALFADLQRMPNAREILADARGFAAQPPETQDWKRKIDQALQTVRQDLTAAQRRAHDALPPEGRAAQTFRLLRTTRPDLLAGLVGAANRD